MNFESMRGMTLSAAVSDGDSVTFTAEDGRQFQLMHNQSCCESVYVESIVGDLSDLVGHPLELCEEATKDDPDAECGQWTFYKMATIKGYVDIRFYGSSNGYYGVGVSFEEVGKSRWG